MPNMDQYRDGLKGNSYTREGFLAKFERDCSTEDFMWEKLRDLDLSGLQADLGQFGLELRGADLTNTDFSQADLPRAHFVQAKLINVNFSGANLREAVFVNSDVRGANFSGAKLSDAGFYEAIYDSSTVFPLSFNPEIHGMIRR